MSLATSSDSSSFEQATSTWCNRPTGWSSRQMRSIARRTRQFERSDEPDCAGSPHRQERSGRLGGRTPIPTAAVVESFADVISFRTRRSGDGFRRPQLGALHSVLGNWASGLSDPAIVVMPTRTGKTDTMLALLVTGRLDRLNDHKPTLFRSGDSPVIGWLSDRTSLQVELDPLILRPVVSLAPVPGCLP